MSNHTRCAACRFLRRRCPEDCVFAPYFPARNPQRFACVHKVYGASNVGKMLQQIPVHLRAQAADSMHFEAHTRIQDPIYGCVGIISRLQQEMYTHQCELAKTRAQIAFYNAHPPAQEEGQLQLPQVESLGFNVHEQDPFHLD